MKAHWPKPKSYYWKRNGKLLLKSARNVVGLVLQKVFANITFTMTQSFEVTLAFLATNS